MVEIVKFNVYRSKEGKEKFYIYKYEFPSGKVYIGKVNGFAYERLYEHWIEEAYNPKSRAYNFPLSNAIRKCGMENVKISIIDEAKNNEELNELEKYWIAYYGGCNSKKNYNCREGGEGGNFSEETKQKMSENNWCKGKFGIKHRNSKPVKGIHIKTEHVLYFGSAMEAERKTGILQESICKCIQGKLQTASGYKWEYISKEEYLKHQNETNYFYQKTWVAYKAIKQGKGKGNVEKGEKVAEFASQLEAENAGFGNRCNISQCVKYWENPEEFVKKYGCRQKTVKGFIWNIEWKQIPFYENTEQEETA